MTSRGPARVLRVRRGHSRRLRVLRVRRGRSPRLDSRACGSLRASLPVSVTALRFLAVSVTARCALRLRLAAQVAALVMAALPFAAPGARGDPAAAAPVCLARAQVVPPEGFPGQQLVWRLEILRRPFTTGVEWLEQPSFPGFRAEWLPGQPELGVTLDGVDYLARVEERALFPERAGELVIAGTRLRCAVAGGPPVDASPSAVRVRVSELPEAGRPEGFSGLVGALAVEIAARPSRLALGASTRLEVALRGDANLWDARDPLTGAPGLDGVELFPARPRLELEPGVQLAVRRTFAYDAVPQREGRLVIPGLRVPYFDPEQRRYQIATSPELAIEVARRPAETGAARAPRLARLLRRARRGVPFRTLAALAAGAHSSGCCGAARAGPAAPRPRSSRLRGAGDEAAARRTPLRLRSSRVWPGRAALRSGAAAPPAASRPRRCTPRARAVGTLPLRSAVPPAARGGGLAIQALGELRALRGARRASRRSEARTSAASGAERATPAPYPQASGVESRGGAARLRGGLHA